MEPAAVLISAFQIHIRRPGQLVLRIENRQMARARIEPDVQDVGFLAETSCAAFCALMAGTDQLGCRFCVPDIGRGKTKLADDALEHTLFREWLSAIFAIEDDDRHAPDALARNAPVRP